MTTKNILTGLGILTFLIVISLGIVYFILQWGSGTESTIEINEDNMKAYISGSGAIFIFILFALRKSLSVILKTITASSNIIVVLAVLFMPSNESIQIDPTISYFTSLPGYTETSSTSESEFKLLFNEVDKQIKIINDSQLNFHISDGAYNILIQKSLYNVLTDSMKIAPRYDSLYVHVFEMSKEEKEKLIESVANNTNTYLQAVPR